MSCYSCQPENLVGRDADDLNLGPSAGKAKALPFCLVLTKIEWPPYLKGGGEENERKYTPGECVYE